MVNISLIRDGDYNDLVELFGEKKISFRYDFVIKFMETYIHQKNLDDYVYIAKSLVEHVIVDYFVDIQRLKPFQNIEFVNEAKIYAYLSYWILRHKPIQLLENNHSKELELDLNFVNEDMVADLISSYLQEEALETPLIKDDSEVVYDFLLMLKYNFCYRSYSAQSLELAITAFNAGRAFQHSVDNVR